MSNQKLQKVWLEEPEIVGSLQKNIRKMAKQLDIPEQKVMKMMKERKKNISVPVSVFNNACSPLENLVYYLAKEGLTQKEIAIMLKRSPATIWTTLMNAEKKRPAQSMEGMQISVSLFADRAFSVLEGLASYIYRQGVSLHKIAVMLGRDDRTIWTVVDRARRKAAKGTSL